MILPFPPARRADFVSRHAARMATLSPKGAERYLARQLQVQADTMARKGIAGARVSQEIAALEAAIRCELCAYMPAPRQYK